MGALLAGALITAALTTALPAGSVPAVASTAHTPPLTSIKHMWVLVLENENADVTFADNSPADYLSKTLPTMVSSCRSTSGSGT